jgi:transposase
MASMARVAPTVVVTEEQRARLQRGSRGRSTAARLVNRAKIVLYAADGWNNSEIADELGLQNHTVALWRRRFIEAAVAGIEKDASGRGRKPTVQHGEIEAEVIRRTTQETPPHATHGSTRSMARAMNISEASVRRIWHRSGLKPHLQRTFKVSNDAQFAEKLHDMVGLYMSPPENAIVFSVDEKSPIQALDRTQPGLPLQKGRAGTMTHDYKRNGTPTLFAALCTLTGSGIRTCMERHRHQEWIRFLNPIDREVPAGLDIHIICDHYATHQHEKVHRWIQRHPRFHVHFTPTSSSWLNLVERFFRARTSDRLQRGVFRSVQELVAAIEAYILHPNTEPKPFIWTKRASDIRAKVMRARNALHNVTSN